MKNSPAQLPCGREQSEVLTEDSGHLARSFPARWPLLELDRICDRNAHRKNPQVPSKPLWSQLSDQVTLTTEVLL